MPVYRQCKRIVAGFGEKRWQGLGKKTESSSLKPIPETLNNLIEKSFIFYMNSFGKKQLEKYGWNQGQGLGKQKGWKELIVEGIKKAIGVSMKNDKEGLGTKSDEWTFQWWYHSIQQGIIYSTRLLPL